MTLAIPPEPGKPPAGLDRVDLALFGLGSAATTVVCTYVLQLPAEVTSPLSTIFGSALVASKRLLQVGITTILGQLPASKERVYSDSAYRILWLTATINQGIDQGLLNTDLDQLVCNELQLVAERLQKNEYVAVEFMDEIYKRHHSYYLARLRQLGS